MLLWDARDGDSSRVALRRSGRGDRLRSRIEAHRAPDAARRQLGAELQRLRTQAGLSGRTLARRLGLSQSKISRIELGTSLPTTNDVAAWAEAVGARTDAREHLLLL